VRNANSTWLNGKPLLSDLQARIGVPVFIENDANCFALSEATDGAAAGFACVFGVILGTGVGGGVVVNGQTIVGRNAIAGEWGHNPLPWPDGDLPAPQQACFCGRTGCIESVLSGPALESQYLALAKRSAGAKLIAERAAKGDTQSQAVLAAYATRLAKALAPVINVLDPDVVVFGGGISNIPFVIERARAELPRWVFSDCCETEFRVNRWGDSSGVRGAARLPPLPT
jgi:fructokinase